MEISYNWLKQYIDLPVGPDALAGILTELGLEVSSVTEFLSIEGGLRGVFTGEVKECVKHPDSDHLSLTKVDVGGETLLDIVCGAPNVAAGQKVIVATIGATLYGMDPPLTMKKAKIRGAVSEGMICAEDEIGLGHSHAGIMVLPAETPVGMPAADYFGLETDYVLEVDLTPNRIDAASHLGVARDLAAWFAKTQAVGYKLPEIKINPETSGTPTIAVYVENTEACPRYMGLHIKNIQISPSPQWLQNRLKAIGLKPINNVVDISNYVLFETGQPLHMFDAAHIYGNTVVVKTLPAGTQFVTLDGITRSLSDKDLMICNQREGMCIAGVFGGLDAGISDTTRDIFIESAYFNPSWVRRTAKRHGISTDSSFRFERGADPDMAPYALLRAAQLVLELAGGEISGPVVDVYPTHFTPVEVPCLFKNIERLTGLPLGAETVVPILKSLEIEVKNLNDTGFTAVIPRYRVDVTREADVIEDILRIYGFNNVPLPDKMQSSLSFTSKPDQTRVQESLAAMLSGMGFSEIMCTSFTRQKYFERFPTTESTVAVHNALSTDLNCMRPDMLFGGLESISRNLKFRTRDMKLYEFGRIYHLFPGEEDKPGQRYRETNCLGLWLTGNQRLAQWNDNERKTGIFTLKGYIEAILKRAGVNAAEMTIKPLKSNTLQNSIAYFRNEQCLAVAGTVCDEVLQFTDIEQEVLYARIDMDAVLKTIRKHRTKVELLPKFPKVERDLALLLDDQVAYDDIRKLAFATERKLLKQVDLFDVYQGKNIPEAKKSYAIRFTLQDTEKTLTDKDIDKVMQRLVMAFTKELGASLR